MTTSLQPIKFKKKPVNIMKGRILAGWAKNLPNPGLVGKQHTWKFTLSIHIAIAVHHSP